MNGPVLLGMGVTGMFDYAGEGGQMEDRLTRCYELAAKAFFDLSSAAYWIEEGNLPTPVALVHGVWSSPATRDKPIPHAWVTLSDGQVWEPITGALCDSAKFYAYTQGDQIMIYDSVQARRNMLRHQHFGPWH